jgi:hypothetical protein|tara:strand:+ start:91 stop:516 length:426 start_codon:yes stop_codon:yes gene_type:complete
MLSSEDVNAIGQLIDTSFGYSSTGEKTFQVPAGRAIKCHLSGESGEDRLVVKFVTVITLHENERNLLDPKNPASRQAERESVKMTKDYVDSLKKSYRSAMEKSLKLKEVSSTDSVELVSHNIYSPVRQVYYRRNTVYDVSV